MVVVKGGPQEVGILLHLGVFLLKDIKLEKISVLII
jgi:hypothetical protein